MRKKEATATERMRGKRRRRRRRSSRKNERKKNLEEREIIDKISSW